jgi:hypothetical protein
VVAKHRRLEDDLSLASVGAPADSDFWPEPAGYGQRVVTAGPAAGNGPSGQNRYGFGYLPPDRYQGALAEPGWAPAPEGQSWREWQDWGPLPELHPDHPSAPVPRIDLPADYFPGRRPDDDFQAVNPYWTADPGPALADSQAAQIAHEAEDYASSILAAAEREAAAITQEAASRAGAITQQATGHAAAIREAAELEAAELRAQLESMFGELGRVAAYVTDSLAAPALPAIVPALPDTGPVLPSTRPVRPDTRPASPDSRPSGPQTRPASPGARPSAPDGPARPARPTGPARPAGPKTAPAKTPQKQTRQHKAMRVATYATATMFLFAAATGAAEIGLHGYKFFVFRGGGVGQTAGSETDQQFLAKEAAAAHHVAAPKGRHAKKPHHAGVHDK